MTLGDGQRVCPRCSQRFMHKSSLTRHTRRCYQNLPAPSRQKACRFCSKGKVRCDLERPRCGTCQARGVVCEFESAADNSGTSPASASSSLNLASRPRSDDAHENGPVAIIDNNGAYLPLAQDGAVSAHWSDPTIRHTHITRSPEEQILDAADQASIFEAIAPRMVISNQRRQELLGNAPGTPSSGSYSANGGHGVIKRFTSHFMSRVLLSWPRMMAMYDTKMLPPLIHSVQLGDGEGSVPGPLVNCFTLTTMWTDHVHKSADLVRCTVLHEIKRLISEYPTYDELDLLAATQALAVLLTILFFGLPEDQTRPHGPAPEDGQLLVDMWDVRRRLAWTGLFLEEELLHTTPSWKKWAIVSAKRRTILVLHHIEFAWSIKHGYPLLPCFELGPMPAPDAGYLWQAADEATWTARYGTWLQTWKDGGSCKMLELMEVGPGKALDVRTEMWLAEVDEFGMMLMAEMNTTDFDDNPSS